MVDAFCCVNFEAGEVFGIFILAKFGVIFLGRHFLLKYMFGFAVLYSRVSFYDGVTFFLTTGLRSYLVVNRIVVKRVLFKWFKLRQVHGPNRLVK